MNAFGVCTAIEARAFVILRPFIEARADDGRLVLINKGALAPFLQETIGDVIANIDGKVFGLELKAEEKRTGNLFLETWSNRNLGHR